MSVSIAICTFRKPAKLRSLLENLKECGLPDIPVRVFEDPSPFEDREETTRENQAVCDEFNVPMRTAPKWGCMHGAIQFAFEETDEDWLIYLPDDIGVRPGVLWQAYATVRTYGRYFVGAIQIPYWNMQTAGGPVTERNPVWERYPVPFKYLNVNGAGFSMSRQLFKVIGHWPRYSWRLDEYASWVAWQAGMVVLAAPGLALLHYGGGSWGLMPEVKWKLGTDEAWLQATGVSVGQAERQSRDAMGRIEGEDFNAVLRRYAL